MIVLHEDDNQILRWNGTSVQLENKHTGVVGVMEIDGDSVIFGSRSRMEMIHIQGNVVVSCWNDIDNDSEVDDDVDDEEDTLDG